MQHEINAKVAAALVDLANTLEVTTGRPFPPEAWDNIDDLVSATRPAAEERNDDE